MAFEYNSRKKGKGCVSSPPSAARWYDPTTRRDAVTVYFHVCVGEAATRVPLEGDMDTK